MIDIVKHLEGLPASRSRFIAVAALNILNAGELATDSRAAAAEARRIYGRRPCHGMWRKVQADARRVIATCNRESITFERPYVLKIESSGRTLLWTVDSRGDLFPATWVGRGKV